MQCDGDACTDDITDDDNFFTWDLFQGNNSSLTGNTEKAGSITIGGIREKTGKQLMGCDDDCSDETSGSTGALMTLKSAPVFTQLSRKNKKFGRIFNLRINAMNNSHLMGIKALLFKIGNSNERSGSLQPFLYPRQTAKLSIDSNYDHRDFDVVGGFFPQRDNLNQDVNTSFSAINSMDNGCGEGQRELDEDNIRNNITVDRVDENNDNAGIHENTLNLNNSIYCRKEENMNDEGCGKYEGQNNFNPNKINMIYDGIFYRRPDGGLQTITSQEFRTYVINDNSIDHVTIRQPSMTNTNFNAKHMTQFDKNEKDSTMTHCRVNEKRNVLGATHGNPYNSIELPSSEQDEYNSIQASSTTKVSARPERRLISILIKEYRKRKTFTFQWLPEHFTLPGIQPTPRV